MSSARRATEDATAREAVVAGVDSAGFVQLLAAPDGDALAAAAVLADALGRADVPFHLRTRPDPLTGDAPAAPTDDGFTLAVGDDDPAADAALVSDETPASATAAAVARDLGVAPDPVLALAGAVAAGTTPGDDGTADVLDAARRRGFVARRPGVAVPTTELADGLAASTLLCAPFSGDVASTRATLSELGAGDPGDLDDDDRRRIAAAVAVDVVTADGAGDRAGEAVERALRPYATPAAPVATVGGYADVLSALAAVEPGLALTLALGDGDDGREAAMDRWRRHGGAAHRLVREAERTRHAGLTVHDAGRLNPDGADAAAALRTAARLCRDFRSPEPVAAAVGRTDEAVLVAVDAVEARAVGDVVAVATDAVEDDTDVDGDGGATTGWARLAVTEPETGAETGTEPELEQFVTTLREALR
ncbi:MAG: exonuclease RecJ [Halolamina sp.]